MIDYEAPLSGVRLVDDHEDLAAARPKLHQGFLAFCLGAQLNSVLRGSHRLLVDLQDNIAAAEAGASRGGIWLNFCNHCAFNLRWNV